MRAACAGRGAGRGGSRTGCRAPAWAPRSSRRARPAPARRTAAACLRTTHTPLYRHDNSMLDPLQTSFWKATTQFFQEINSLTCILIKNHSNWIQSELQTNVIVKYDRRFSTLTNANVLDIYFWIIPCLNNSSLISSLEKGILFFFNHSWMSLFLDNINWHCASLLT